MNHTKQNPAILKQMEQIADLLIEGFSQGRPMMIIVDQGDTLQSARINFTSSEAASIPLLLLAEDWLGQAMLDGNEFACLQARQRVRTALKMMGAATYEENEQ